MYGYYLANIIKPRSWILSEIKLGFTLRNVLKYTKKYGETQVWEIQYSGIFYKVWFLKQILITNQSKIVKRRFILFLGQIGLSAKIWKTESV